jgi:hypothetical protein
MAIAITTTAVSGAWAEEPAAMIIHKQGRARSPN